MHATVILLFKLSYDRFSNDYIFHNQSRFCRYIVLHKAEDSIIKSPLEIGVYNTSIARYQSLNTIWALWTNIDVYIKVLEAEYISYIVSMYKE